MAELEATTELDSMMELDCTEEKSEVGLEDMVLEVGVMEDSGVDETEVCGRDELSIDELEVVDDSEEEDGVETELWVCGPYRVVVVVPVMVWPGESVVE